MDEPVGAGGASDAPQGVQRRDVLRWGGVATTMVWAAPTVQSIGMSAALAQAPSVPPQVCEAVFVLMDEDAIDNLADTTDTTVVPARFTSADVNDDIAAPTQRRVLRYFANPANFGTTLTIFTGQTGDEGVFALEAVPQSWADAGPSNDGLRNFLGNGASDAGAAFNDTAILDQVPQVVPLRCDGLQLLEGRTVLALVHDSDISINYGPITGNLKGSYLGLAAFQVVDVVQRAGTPNASSSSLCALVIRVVDPATVIGCNLTLLDAPDPTSSSEPNDVLVP